MCQALRARPENLLQQVSVGKLSSFTTSNPEKTKVNVTSASISLTADSEDVESVIFSPSIGKMTTINNNGFTEFYVEMSISALGGSDLVAIGLGPKEHLSDELPGLTERSVGLFSEDGVIYITITDKLPSVQFTLFDVVGMGITNDGKIFYTLNGSLISFAQISIPSNLLNDGADLHLIVGLAGKGTCVELNTDPTTYLFMFEKVPYSHGQEYHHNLSPSMRDKEFTTFVCSDENLLPHLINLIGKSTKEKTFLARILLHLLAGDESTKIRYLANFQNCGAFNHADEATKRMFNTLISPPSKENAGNQVSNLSSPHASPNNSAELLLPFAALNFGSSPTQKLTRPDRKSVV